MATPMLATKLYIPLPRPERVLRPRLIERLNAGLRSGRKLTLISAPAGFGKTTLLSEWVSQCPTPVAWLSLEESDNDLARFLSYLIAALQTIHVDIGQATLAMLQSPQLPSSESLLTALINDVAAIPHTNDAPSHPLILVLDDYHLIETQAIHHALAFLIEHLPPSPGGMRLVIASRNRRAADVDLELDF